MLAAILGITHALRIPVEVIRFGTKLLDHLGIRGIDGPKRLFKYTPETLVKHLGEVAAEKKLTGPVPTLQEITPWFENPKPETVVVK